MSTGSVEHEHQVLSAHLNSGTTPMADARPSSATNDEELNEEEHSKASGQTVVARQDQQQQQQLSGSAVDISQEDSNRVEEMDDNGHKPMQLSREPSLEEGSVSRNMHGIEELGSDCMVDSESNMISRVMAQQQQVAVGKVVHSDALVDPLVARMRDIVEGNEPSKQQVSTTSVQEQLKSRSGDSLSPKQQDNTPVVQNPDASAVSGQQKRARHPRCSGHHHHHMHHGHHHFHSQHQQTGQQEQEQQPPVKSCPGRAHKRRSQDNDIKQQELASNQSEFKSSTSSVSSHQHKQQRPANTSAASLDSQTNNQPSSLTKDELRRPCEHRHQHHHHHHGHHHHGHHHHHHHRHRHHRKRMVLEASTTDPATTSTEINAERAPLQELQSGTSQVVTCCPHHQERCLRHLKKALNQPSEAGATDHHESSNTTTTASERDSKGSSSHHHHGHHHHHHHHHHQSHGHHHHHHHHHHAHAHFQHAHGDQHQHLVSGSPACNRDQNQRCRKSGQQNETENSPGEQQVPSAGESDRRPEADMQLAPRGDEPGQLSGANSEQQANKSYEMDADQVVTMDMSPNNNGNKLPLQKELQVPRNHIHSSFEQPSEAIVHQQRCADPRMTSASNEVPTSKQIINATTSATSANNNNISSSSNANNKRHESEIPESQLDEQTINPSGASPTAADADRISKHASSEQQPTKVTKVTNSSDFCATSCAGLESMKCGTSNQHQLIECVSVGQPAQGSQVRPKQVSQSPDRRCRLCWCCCCPCSGLSNKSNASKVDPKQTTERALALPIDRCPSLQKVRSWAKSFEKLMKCPDGRRIFQEFLRCEYSEENILFWVACEELKNEKDAKTIATRARDIYEDYISILSAKEVSLDSRVRDVINNNIKKPTSNIFDEAQLQIYTLMHRDSYPRFINSPMYKKLAQLNGSGNSQKSAS